MDDRTVSAFLELVASTEIKTPFVVVLDAPDRASHIASHLRAHGYDLEWSEGAALLHITGGPEVD